MIVIRTAERRDATALLDLKHTLDQTTTNMLLEVGERQSTVAAVEAEIDTILGHSRSTLLVAMDANLMVGYGEAVGGQFQRNAHSAMIVMGVRGTHRNLGVGGGLLRGLTHWADVTRMERLELTVQQRNRSAIRLYQRHGFHVEGYRRRSLLVEGQWVDELAMARFAPPPVEGSNG